LCGFSAHKSLDGSDEPRCVLEPEGVAGIVKQKQLRAAHGTGRRHYREPGRERRRGGHVPDLPGDPGWPAFALLIAVKLPPSGQPEITRLPRREP
jgi:hypothetical protein